MNETVLRDFQRRPLAPGQKTVLQVKLLVFRGRLDEALKKVVAQCPELE
jgi:hypothetical protein